MQVVYIHAVLEHPPPQRDTRLDAICIRFHASKYVLYYITIASKEATSLICIRIYLSTVI